jgi:hypothetical protein
MRVVSLFRKTMIENIRDWKILSLTLTFAPFFVGARGRVHGARS